MLDFVMHVKILEVEGIFTITLLQELSGVVGHKETERRRKVICCANLMVHFRELNILSIVRKDICIIELLLNFVGEYRNIRKSPWLAIAFNAGHEHRLSPSFLGTYSGHFPSKPGCPLGVTFPTGLFGNTRLRRVNNVSQENK